MLFVFLVNDKLYKIALLHCCIVALLHCCIVALLHCCIVALLHCCIVALLDYGSRENKEIYRCMG